MRIQPDDVLLVVDVQNDFCPGGALAVADGDAVVPVVNRLIERFEHVVLTQDWHPPRHGSFASSHPGSAPFETIAMPYGQQTLWPDHCMQGTPGAELCSELDMDGITRVFRKGMDATVDSYSGFFDNGRRSSTGLGEWLRAEGIDPDTRKIKVGSYDITADTYGAVPLTVGGRAVGG